MMQSKEFYEKLYRGVIQQLRSQKVGYLLGAGASYLNGDGYPLAADLWNCIRDDMPEVERTDIQAKLDDGADGLEHALDLLDDGSPNERPHRHLVTEAIGNHFISLTPPLNCYESFVKRISARNERSVPVFSLNYDPLVELAADQEKVRLFSGFSGSQNCYFDPQRFIEFAILAHVARGRRVQADYRTGIINLYKLHGSLGWYQFADGSHRKLSYATATPAESKRLMVPPQNRKVVETTAQPYSSLWSDFRSLLSNSTNMINRLVSIGYGFRDEHVNAVVENALSRTNFTLLIFAYDLVQDVFDRWASNPKVIVVTQSQCSIFGEIGPGHEDLWSFERISQEV